MFSFPEKETLKQYLADRCFESNSVQLYVAFDYAYIKTYSITVVFVTLILFKDVMCPMTIKMPYGEEGLPDLKASFLMCMLL